MEHPLHTLCETINKLHHVEKRDPESDESLIDGWLGYDFCGRNAFTRHILGLPDSTFFTRRFFYWIPRDSMPVKLVHKIDEPLVTSLYGKTICYRSQNELESILFSFLRGNRHIAMEYWSHALIPLMSIVDAGTKELIEFSGVKVVSSWPLLGPFLAQLSDHQIATHQQAAHILKKAFLHAWSFLQEKLKNGTRVMESTLQKVLTDVISQEGATFEAPPIVAANAHSAIPHFHNNPSMDIAIGANSVVLIDAWCRMASDPQSIYADLTDIAYTGSRPPDPLSRLYESAQEARKKTIAYIQELYGSQTVMTGEMVDLFTRSILKERGVLGLALHRTGHNISTTVHGPSTNLDGYETVDVRPLYERHLYSVEPGLYIDEAYGVRLECNVLLNTRNRVSLEESAGISSDTLPCLHCHGV